MCTNVNFYKGGCPTNYQKIEHVNAVTSKLKTKKCIHKNGVETAAKEKMGNTNTSFIVYLGRLKEIFFDKYMDRKQKAFMRNRLISHECLE